MAASVGAGSTVSDFNNEDEVFPTGLSFWVQVLDQRGVSGSGHDGVTLLGHIFLFSAGCHLLIDSLSSFISNHVNLLQDVFNCVWMSVQCTCGPPLVSHSSVQSLVHLDGVTFPGRMELRVICLFLIKI